MLYVTIEAWGDIGLSDPEVDRLLSSPNVLLLKQYRNGMFHFQGEWLHPKLTDIFGSPDIVPWGNSLMEEMSRFLDAEMKRINAKHQTP